MHTKTILPSAALAAALFAAPATALTPLPPCEVSEAGMIVYALRDLSSGRPDMQYPTGVVIENYQVSTAPGSDGVYRNLPAPTPELNDFFGARLTFCATGDFLAIPMAGPDEATIAIRSTEFVRPDFKAKQPLSFRNLQRAAAAVFEGVIVLRESAETCGCNVYYPDLRPDSLTPYTERKDVKARN